MPITLRTACTPLWAASCLLFLTPCAWAATPSLITVRSAPTPGPVLGAQVIPAQVVVLRARMGGVVNYVGVRQGMPVGPGQVLVTLNTDALQAQAAQAQAAYSAALVAQHNGYSQYNVQLYNYGGGNPWNPFQWIGQGFSALMGNSQNPWATYLAQLDQRRAEALQAGSNVTAAAWHIREIDAQIRDAWSRSPFYGVVLQKSVNPGDIVQPGQTLLTLGSAGPAQVLVQVPTALAGDLQQGEAVAVQAPGNSARTEAHIVEIAPEANIQTHTLAVKLALPRDSGIRAGDWVTVRLPGQAHQGQQLVIPRSALLSSSSLPSVLVDVDGITQVRILRLGEALPGDQVQVLAGLRAGEIVVDDPPAGTGAGWHIDTGNGNGA